MSGLDLVLASFRRAHSSTPVITDGVARRSVVAFSFFSSARRLLHLYSNYPERRMDERWMDAPWMLERRRKKKLMISFNIKCEPRCDR